MFCKKCGVELKENTNFCSACGNPVASEAENTYSQHVEQTVSQPAQPAYQAPAQPWNNKPILPKEHEPLSAWMYFGLQLLFSIPLVGFIFLIIYSCDNSNINRRNFARSYWCSLIIVGIVLVVFLIFTAIFGFTMMSYGW